MNEEFSYYVSVVVAFSRFLDNFPFLVGTIKSGTLHPLLFSLCVNGLIPLAQRPEYEHCICVMIYA